MKRINWIHFSHLALTICVAAHGATAAPLTAREIEADLRLDREITQIQADYPDLDWSGRDGSGHNLEVRIIDFMLETKNYSFTSGFNLYLKENRALPERFLKNYGIPE